MKVKGDEDRNVLIVDSLQYSMENAELVELLTNKEMVKWQEKSVPDVVEIHLS